MASPHSKTGSAKSASVETLAVEFLDAYSRSGVYATPPKEYKRAEEWSSILGRSLSRTYAILADMMSSGRVEKKVFRVIVRGRATQSPHYRLVKGGEK